jgi:hypothetical protein
VLFQSIQHATTLTCAVLPIMQLRYRIQPMGTAEHQPRVGDKRSSAQPCRQRGDARGSPPWHRHDTHEACKRMRPLSISDSICIPT